MKNLFSEHDIKEIMADIRRKEDKKSIIIAATIIILLLAAIAAGIAFIVKSKICNDKLEEDFDAEWDSDDAPEEMDETEVAAEEGCCCTERDLSLIHI